MNKKHTVDMMILHEDVAQIQRIIYRIIYIYYSILQHSIVQQLIDKPVRDLQGAPFCFLQATSCLVVETMVSQKSMQIMKLLKPLKSTNPKKKQKNMDIKHDFKT